MRILIADDDPTSRILLNTIASRQGHECVQAADGATAWELLLRESVDVLLSDWMMPGLDGPQLCRRVREEVTEQYVYIVLITGLGDRQQILQGMTAGADDYLVKPIDPFALQTRLVAAERVTSLHRQVAHFRAELERANLELLGLSLTDALTGLGNRRHMEQDLAHIHARARRTGRSYALGIFDVDYFKLYNDHYGHLAGDDALRRVGQCLRSNVRAGDRVYRYGGEEFLVLMPDCDLDQAAGVAERVAAAVRELGIPHETRPVGPKVVTLSAGVASSPPAGPAGSVAPAASAAPAGHAASVAPAGETDLMRRADQALYEAKARGRNCLRVAAPAAVAPPAPAAVAPAAAPSPLVAVPNSRAH